MSLEQALIDNTAAMRELTAILKGGAMEAPKPAKPAKAEAPKAEPKVEAPKAEPKVEGPSRKAVADKVIAFGKDKGRDAALELLGKFGAKNLQQVPDDKLADLDSELAKVAA